MSEGNDYRQQVEEAAARVAWCERKLLFERKRHRALKDLATTEDWLDGKLSPLPKTEGTRERGLTGGRPLRALLCFATLLFQALG